MCWSRGLAISSWRSLTAPKCTKVHQSPYCVPFNTPRPLGAYSRPAERLTLGGTPTVGRVPGLGSRFDGVDWVRGRAQIGQCEPPGRVPGAAARAAAPGTRVAGPGYESAVPGWRIQQACSLRTPPALRMGSAAAGQLARILVSCTVALHAERDAAPPISLAQSCDTLRASLGSSGLALGIIIRACRRGGQGTQVGLSRRRVENRGRQLYLCVSPFK